MRLSASGGNEAVGNTAARRMPAPRASLAPVTINLYTCFRVGLRHEAEPLMHRHAAPVATCGAAAPLANSRAQHVVRKGVDGAGPAPHEATQHFLRMEAVPSRSPDPRHMARAEGERGHLLRRLCSTVQPPRATSDGPHRGADPPRPPRRTEDLRHELGPGQLRGHGAALRLHAEVDGAELHAALFQQSLGLLAVQAARAREHHDGRPEGREPGRPAKRRRPARPRRFGRGCCWAWPSAARWPPRP